MKFKHLEVQDLLTPQADLYFNALEHERLEEVKHLNEALSVVRQLGEDKIKEISKILNEVDELANDEIKILTNLLEKEDKKPIPYSSFQALISSPRHRLNTMDNYLQKEVDKLSEKNGYAF